MEKQVKLKKFIWIMYIGVFLLTASICLLRSFVSVEMKLVSDNIGCMFVPSHLVGRDWSDMISWLPYYGWLYYIIYTPVFALTNNPYIIYYVFCIGNMLVLCLISVLIFHCLVKYLKVENIILAMATAVLCTSYAIVFSANFSSELPVLLAVWIVVYLLLKLNTVIDLPQKKNVYTILLLFSLMCTINIHTRLIMMWMVLFAVIVVFFLVYKKWLVNPWIFSVGSVIAYTVGRGMKNLVVNWIWQAGELGELHNATIDVVDYVKELDTSIKVIFDIIISNLYKLNMQTSGIAMIVIIMVSVFICQKLLMLFKRRINATDNNELENDIERGIFLVSTVFLLCLIGTICALPLYYGSGIAAGYEMGVENGRFSAFTYLRYYLQYFGPVFVCAIVILAKRKEYDKKIAFSSVFAAVLIALYVVSCVLPHLSVYYVNFIIRYFWTKDIYRLSFAVSMAIILLLMILWNVLLQKKKVQIVVLGLCLIYVGSYFKNMSNPFMNITIPSAGNSVYSVLSVADDKINLPREIYCMSDTKIQVALQILLNEYLIKLSEPISDLNEGIVVTNAYDSVGTDMLLQQGYKYWVLDNNECLWVKGVSLQEQLEPYITQYISEKKEINDITINYGEKTISVFGTVFQPTDGVAATATILKPVPGEYEICVSMNTIHVPTEMFGVVEVILDGEIIAKENIEVDESGNATVCIPVYMGNIDECQIQYSFLKNTIINDLTTTTQCTNPKWIVGREDSEELEELESIMELTNVTLPVKIMGYNNPYSNNVDLSIMEDAFHVEQVNIIDSNMVAEGKVKENCYLLLQNNNESLLIFDLVENYNILWKTQHYTLLMYNDERNRTALEVNDCMMLSEDGAINVNYFRLDVDGSLRNDILVDLPKGAYEITEYHDIRNIPQQHNVFFVNKLEEETWTLLSTHQASVSEDEDMLVGKQTISVNDGELYSFNWNYNAIDAETTSQAFISRRETVYEAGDIIDFSVAGERPFYYTGIGGAEEWGAWSTELETIIELNVKCKDSITLDIMMWTYMAQDVTISVNGTELTVLPVGESLDTYSITVPKEYLENGTLELTLSVNQLCSPNERNGSPDMRKLGIGISQIDFK